MNYFVKKFSSPYDSIYISVRGFSHKIKGTKCQDYSKCFVSNDYGICIAADGHGSSKHFRSDKGSKFAVFAAIESIKAYMKDRDTFDSKINIDSDKVLRRIEANILYRWNKKVHAHYNKNPLTDDEKDKLPNIHNINIESIYGSTLIIGVITTSFWFGIQIGDGKLVSLFDDGSAKELIPNDDRLVANFTTSLCDNNALLNFRHIYSDKMPYALLSSTDGLFNSFTNDDSFYRFNKMIVSEIKKERKAAKYLRNHLMKRSEDGSLDDISIASVYKKVN